MERKTMFVFQEVPIVLVGNKVDLGSDARQVGGKMWNSNYVLALTSGCVTHEFIYVGMLYGAWTNRQRRSVDFDFI